MDEIQGRPRGTRPLRKGNYLNTKGTEQVLRSRMYNTIKPPQCGSPHVID